MRDSIEIDMYEVECCGETQRTPYCPRCGKELTPVTTMARFLNYLKIQGDKAAKVPSRAKRESQEDYDAKVRAAERAALKWRAWEKGLTNLIDFYREHRGEGSQE